MAKQDKWQDTWREEYKFSPQSMVPFYLWLRFVKGWSQIEIQRDLDLDDDEHFALLEEYGKDPEICRLSEECLKEMRLQ